MVEPEWNETYRELVEGLAAVERDCCPNCGLHPFILAHPEWFHLTLEEHVCPMCSYRDQRQRGLDERDTEHRHAHKNLKPGDPLPTDGLRLVIKSLTAAEAAQRRRIDRKGAADG